MDTTPLMKLFTYSFSTLFKHKVRPSKMRTYLLQNVFFKNLSPDILFLRNIHPLPATQNNMLLLVKKRERSQCFSALINKNKFLNKLIPHEHAVQVPMKLFTHKAEVENLIVDGVGWAGQPIVKRIHPILPEVYGDVSDIFYPMEKLQSSKIPQEECFLTSQLQKREENIKEFPEVDYNKKPDDVCEKEQDRIVRETEELAYPVDRHVQNQDIILFGKNIQDSVKDSVTITENGEINLSPNVISKQENSSFPKKILPKMGLVKNENKNYIKSGSTLFKHGILSKNSKKKIRKKTIVCGSKTGLTLNVSKLKTAKKKKNKVKSYGINKKNNLEPLLILNQRTNIQPFSNNVLVMENRQLKTDSSLNHQNLSADISVKEKVTKVGVTAISKKKGSKMSKENNKSSDDCVCPETLEITKERKNTKICGEAGEGDQKKKKKWKGKMCRVEPAVFKHRRRTVVCASKVKKDKRKRELPKCVKPEKKKPPTVIICPPRIDKEQEGKSKICEKQVEEVKVRKRTKVCRPVIIYGKEETQIKVEKSVCKETRVKKKISRHTKICPPPGKDNKKNKDLHII